MRTFLALAAAALLAAAAPAQRAVGSAYAQQARAAEARERQAERQRSGYSHTVEAGQTLSAIALAYKVSVKAIMQANNITDPTKLRVGQTLFIPDP